MIRSFQLVRGRFGRVFVIVVLSMLIQFTIFAFIFRIFLPELDLLSVDDTEQIQIQLGTILQNAGVHRAMRLSQYLTALIFFPFAALLTVLLYFDLVNQEGQVKSDYFSKLATQFFGIGNQDSMQSKPTSED